MTLASDYKPTTPDHPGTKQKQLNRGSVSDTLPPTLLRLPNLNPAEPPATHPPPEPEAITPAAPPRQSQTPETSGPETCELQSSRPNPADSIGPTGSANDDRGIDRREAQQPPFPPPSQNREAAPLSTPAAEAQAAPAKIGARSAASLLTQFASRKTLVVLLLLIVGLAVLMPRSSESGPEVLPPALAKSDQPTPSPPSTATASSAESHIPGDPAATKHSRHAPASADTDGQPADIARSELASPIAPSTSMIQQPDSDETPGEAAPLQRPLQSQFASSQGGTASASGPNGPSEFDRSLPSFETDAAASFPPAGDASDFDTEDDGVTASLAASANEEIRRLDAARSATPSREQDSPTGAKPDFVHSHTPNPITNWDAYLPSLEPRPVAVQSATYQPPAGAPLDEPLHPTGMSGAPDFQFALPDGSGPHNPAQESGPAAPPSAAQDAASAAPDARVAMPPTTGFPGPGGINR